MMIPGFGITRGNIAWEGRFTHGWGSSSVALGNFLTLALGVFPCGSIEF